MESLKRERESNTEFQSKKHKKFHTYQSVMFTGPSSDPVRLPYLPKNPEPSGIAPPPSPELSLKGEVCSQHFEIDTQSHALGLKCEALDDIKSRQLDQEELLSKLQAAYASNLHSLQEFTARTNAEKESFQKSLFTLGKSNEEYTSKKNAMLHAKTEGLALNEQLQREIQDLTHILKEVSSKTPLLEEESHQLDLKNIEISRQIQEMTDEYQAIERDIQDKNDIRNRIEAQIRALNNIDR